MSWRTWLLPLAFWTSACSGEPTSAPKHTAPTFPSALRGCWDLREPPSEEYPDGLSEILTIAPDRIIREAKGVGRKVGTIERVDRLTRTLIGGLISAREGDQWTTLATSLELKPEGSSAGTLRLQEGDAGSYDFVRCAPDKAAEQRFSLVIAETAHQDDPRPAPCGPNGDCDGFLYRAEFHGSRVIAGAELSKRFNARLTLHTPYISAYVLALIVERQSDGSLLVRRQAGFNGRNGIACFNEADERPVNWRPEEVPDLRHDHGDLCVFDKGQIDPNAPKS